MRKNVSIKKSPLYNNEPTLDFDDEILELDDEQKMGRFMSRWMTKTDPFVKYEKYFKNSTFKENMILKLIKNNYKKCVIDNGWSEYKFVVVIDNMFLSNNSFLDDKIIKQYGMIFDKEELPTQKIVKRAERRKRI